MEQFWTKSFQARFSIQILKTVGFSTRYCRNNFRRHASTSTTIDAHDFAKIKKQEFKQRLKHSPYFLKGREGANEAKRTAAVLVPFCIINGVPSLLFTLRSSKLLHYKGDVSFPGGLVEPEDKSLTETALRETQEELGILRHQIDVWGCINPVGSRHNDTAVTPVVGFVNLESTEHLKINKGEVECVFTRTVQSLCDPKNCYSTQYRIRKGLTLPVYLGGDFRIWGLTAVILHIALKLVIPENYKFELPYIK